MLLSKNYNLENEKLDFKSRILKLQNNLKKCCNDFNSNSVESEIKQSLNGIIFYFAIKRN